MNRRVFQLSGTDRWPVDTDIRAGVGTDTVGGGVLESTIKNWLDRINKNGELRDAGKEIVGKLVPFYDERTTFLRLG